MPVRSSASSPRSRRRVVVTSRAVFRTVNSTSWILTTPCLFSLSGDSPPQTPPPERPSVTRCPPETRKFLRSLPPRRRYGDTAGRNSTQRRPESRKQRKGAKTQSLGFFSVISYLCVFAPLRLFPSPVHPTGITGLPKPGSPLKGDLRGLYAVSSDLSPRTS